MTEYVKVEGLRELSKALRDVDKDLPKELTKAAKKAAEAVADKTRASFSGRGGVAPKVAPSVKALASQRAAHVRIGGAKYPYAMGAEFGGGKYAAGRPSPRGGYTSQFDPWRGNTGDVGYSLFPTIKSMRDEITETFGDALDDAMRRAFP